MPAMSSTAVSSRAWLRRPAPNGGGHKPLKGLEGQMRGLQEHCSHGG